MGRVFENGRGPKMRPRSGNRVKNPEQANRILNTTHDTRPANDDEPNAELYTKTTFRPVTTI